jgi:thiamine pyrophosphate-dependent acetolactate synthase large subunit-like protein
MTRLEAIRLVIDTLEEDALVIHANGAISRESFFCHNREENFSLLGSMGLASSVALGVAIHHLERKVIVLDGDGNILMGLGNLALIGSLNPKKSYSYSSRQSSIRNDRQSANDFPSSFTLPDG